MPGRALSSNNLADFDPRQIICREMNVGEDPANTRFVDIDLPTKWGKNRFARLLRQAADGRFDRNSPDLEERNRLDIPVYRASYIVLQISPGSRWSFAREPVKLKGDAGNAGDYFYGGLRFVGAGGQPYEEYFEHCKVIYFQARFKRGYPGEPHTQSLDYYVDPHNKRAAEIDPDVRHPGVGGSVYEPYP